MTYAAIHDAIRTRFKSEVADVASLPVEYPNAPFDTPDDSTRWMRMSIRSGESFQAGIGAGSVALFRRVGELIVQVFGPVQPDTGSPTGDLMDLADTIAAAFRRVSASNVTYMTPSVTEVGRTGAWWQVNVNCPWYSDVLA